MMAREVEEKKTDRGAAAGYICLPHATLSDGRFTVRSVRPADIESIRIWRNAQLDVLRQEREITPQQQAAYYTEHVWPAMELLQPRNILLSYLKDEHLVGYGGVVHIAWEHLRSELSFLLDPAIATDSEQYQTCFTTFLKLMQILAFRDLGLTRLCTETYATRTLHIGILENAGFEREGVLRNHVRIRGRPVDSVIHGCLSTVA